MWVISKIQKTISVRRAKRDAIAELARIRPDLAMFCSELEQVERDLGHGKEPLGVLVDFFNVVSPRQDRGIHKLLTAFADAGLRFEEVEILENHLHNAGRARHGWNRTEPGEHVTMEKVWLGGIFGLWTFQASDWITKKDDPYRDWTGSTWESYCNGLNAYEVVARHTRRFMLNHTKEMIPILRTLRDLRIV